MCAQCASVQFPVTHYFRSCEWKRNSSELVRKFFLRESCQMSFLLDWRTTAFYLLESNVLFYCATTIHLFAKRKSDHLSNAYMFLLISPCTHFYPTTESYAVLLTTHKLKRISVVSDHAGEITFSPSFDFVAFRHFVHNYWWRHDRFSNWIEYNVLLSQHKHKQRSIIYYTGCNNRRWLHWLHSVEKGFYWLEIANKNNHDEGMKNEKRLAPAGMHMHSAWRNKKRRKCSCFKHIKPDLDFVLHFNSDRNGRPSL